MGEGPAAGERQAHMLTDQSISELLAEKAGEVERAIPEDKVLHSAIRMASIRLAGADRAKPIPGKDLLPMLKGWSTLGIDLACYLEDRTTKTIQGGVMQPITQGGWFTFRDAGGLKDVLDIKTYGKEWRIWTQLPRSAERNAPWED